MKEKPISLSRAAKCCPPIWIHYPGKGSDEFYEKYKFHYEDSWNADSSIAYYALLVLTQLRDSHDGYPACLCVHYEDKGYDHLTAVKKAKAMYKTILNKIIRGFYIYVTVFNPDKKQQKIIDKAWKLYVEWYPSFWD